MAPVDQLSLTFGALADPTRRDILARLRNGPATVSDLASNYAMSRPAISQHLSVLERAGLIAREQRAQWRECRLEREGLAGASEWIEDQRADWSERFDLLEEHIRHKRMEAEQ